MTTRSPPRGSRKGFRSAQSNELALRVAKLERLVSVLSSRLGDIELFLGESADCIDDDDLNEWHDNSYLEE